MQKDKACRCVTSRMFPHRESKCSMRTNPATTIFNVASQASSGVSSIISPSTSTASTVRNDPVCLDLNDSNSPTFPQRSKIEDNQQKLYSGSHEEDEMTEALLAIALLESQTQEKNDVTPSHAEFVAATSLATEFSETDTYSTQDRVTQETSPTKHEQTPSAIREKCTFLETAQYQPVYAQPCASNDLVCLPMTPQELQDLENLQNQTNTIGVVEPYQTQHSARMNNAQCDCVSSRLFPHRANKCTFRGRTGGSQTEPVASGNVTPEAHRSDAVGGTLSAGAMQTPESTELSGVATIATALDEEGSEIDEADITNSNKNSNSNQANTGSRPCRCVSAAMFPHRANKCKLFNTTHAGTSAVAKGAAQVGHVVSGGTSRLSHSIKQSGDEGRRKEHEQTIGETNALETKRLQGLRNIPTERLLRSLLHMVGVNIAFICAVSVVFLVPFGVCGHAIRWVLRVLRRVILRY